MIEISVNGVKRSVAAEADKPLLWVLREDLKLTGTKYGCGVGACGACTVLVGAEAVRSCQLTVADAAGAEITTIEGMRESGRLDSYKAAWIAEQAPQCGYCQPGMIMAAAGLLAATPKPTSEDIRAQITNVCRCGTYLRVERAILRVADTSGA